MRPNLFMKHALDNLANGEIRVLCTVDVFNEGADLPFIECLLFLRPTESKRIFYQQLGRGLRQYSGRPTARLSISLGTSTTHTKSWNIRAFFLLKKVI